MIMAKQAHPLGLYLHIPFCRSKCAYCDFYSLSGREDRMDAYTAALERHLIEVAPQAAQHSVDTVYFGGGTPSYLGEKRLAKLLKAVKKHYHVDPHAEITLEANPDSAGDWKALRALRRAGFNRISIGVQSDQDDMLKRLGRPHTYEQARMAVVRAREAGFANLSLDLMFGLPNQTLTGWRGTLENVLRLKPEHMSCYALKVEPNTPLWEYRDCANLPNDDVQADMYLAASEILQDHGYEHYEISNFAKPGFRSRHNLKYWTGGEYLGFGPCAASDFAGKRFTIEPDLRTYVEGIAHHGAILSECETIPPRERAGEYVMLRSRIVSGLDAQEYERSYLLPFAPLQQLLERFAGHGLAAQSGSRWYLTPRGWLVSNRIILALQDAQEKSTPLAKKR